MKHIHKKVLALMLALVAIFSTTSVAFAAESSEITTMQNAVNEVSPYAAGVLYEYKNEKFQESAVVYFTSPLSGKGGVLLAAAPLDGSTGVTVTATLYVKNILGNYAEVVSYTVDANGKASTKYSDTQIYAGEQCMLTIRANTNKPTCIGLPSSYTINISN